MPVLRVIRDQHANPTDRMTWAGFDADGWTREFCGTVPQPWPEYCQYATLQELDGADLYDVADLMYPWAQEAVERWPGRVLATIWENIPLNHWSPAAARMLAAVRAFIPRSLTAARCLESYGVEGERVHLVPPAVDTRLFPPPAQARRLTGERRVLYVGRITWEKGICDLAYACRGQDWGVTLVGDGPLGEWARAAFGEAALGDEYPVGVTGWLDHDTMLAPLMGAADVLVLPSLPCPGWIEQFGVAVIEAMAVGTPVVTTDCGAFREIVPRLHMTYRYDRGWQPCVPCGRWDDLREAVNRLLGEPDLWSLASRMGVYCVQQEYSHEVVGERLREVYAHYV